MLLKNISKNSNTSGQGADCVVPEEIAKKFNLGAIFIGFIWGPFNKTYITLAILPLAILPGTGFAALTLALFFGIKGNEWAWKNKKWESIEQFNQVQRRWAIAGIIWFIINITISIFMKLNS